MSAGSLSATLAGTALSPIYSPTVTSVWTKMAVFASLARQTADILYSWSTKIPPHVGSRDGERRYNRQEGGFYT